MPPGWVVVRKALVMAAFLMSLALSGCADGGDDRGDGDDGSRRSGGRTSDDGNTTEVPHDKVEFFAQTVMLAGQGTQDFDVVVPANATAVDFTITAGGATGLASFSMFRVELEGCGMYDQGTGISGGSATLAARLCNDAADGPRQLHVSNTGYVEGTLRLVGHVPRANETAVA